MTFRRSHLLSILQLAITAAVITTLLSCGTQDNPIPPITVTFSTGFVPPGSLNTGAYAGIAGTVTNDPKNGGVGFSCTPVGACGTFTPGGAPSTIPVCYLAPSTVPAGNTVTVTATSVSDNTKFKSATITILNGAPNPCPP